MLKYARWTVLTFVLFMVFSVTGVRTVFATEDEPWALALGTEEDSNSAIITGSQHSSSGAGESFVDVDSSVPSSSQEASEVVHRVNTKALHWCLERLRDNITSHECLKRFDFNETDGEQAEDLDVPSDDEVMRMAVAHARIDGAGVIVTPGREWVYAGIPVLARAGTAVVETSVELFGLKVPVRFEAMEFVFDFHDGNAPTRSSTPGLPYPDMSIQGTYHEHGSMQHVTLRVTWRAVVTHPVSGRTFTLDAALKTVEQSREFKVEKARVRLVAP